MDAVTTAKELNLLYMKVFIQMYSVNLEYSVVYYDLL